MNFLFKFTFLKNYIVTYLLVHATNMTGSNSDDWIY
jgi:hypothetical protein